MTILAAIEDDVADLPRHSWQPASLIELAANPPEPPTIGGLLYPGKRTVLSGETESMKTWFALILAKAEIDAGYPVAWVDLDAMGPGSMLERLTLLGVNEQAIDRDFLYIQPTEMADLYIAELASMVATLQIRLFVIDAFNPFLSMHDLEPNSTPDIDRFWRTYADPICNAGAAVALLDHVVKNTETRGKYSYGSERKASGAIVHLGFRLLEPLTKGGRGRSLLTVHKDRPGYLPRPALGRLVLTSDTTAIRYELEPDKTHETGGFRPTVLMEKISRKLEPETEAVATKWIEDNVGGKTDAKRTALQTLVDDGYLTKQPGPRNAVLYRSIRPYRELQDTPDPDLAPPRPDLVLDLRSRPTSTPSPPLKGTRSGEDLGEDTDSTSPQLIHEYDFPPNYNDPGPAELEPTDEAAWHEPDGPANGNEP